MNEVDSTERLNDRQTDQVVEIRRREVEGSERERRRRRNG
jgi:hypothetical protein